MNFAETVRRYDKIRVKPIHGSIGLKLLPSLLVMPLNMCCTGLHLFSTWPGNVGVSAAPSKPRPTPRSRWRGALIGCQSGGFRCGASNSLKWFA